MVSHIVEAGGAGAREAVEGVDTDTAGDYKPEAGVIMDRGGTADGSYGRQY